MTEIFYSRGPAVDDFDTHKTEAEASAQAEHLLALCAEEASDSGWDDNVSDIAYGRLIPLCECVQGPERESLDPQFEYICDYSLRELPDPYAALQKRVTELETAARKLTMAINNQTNGAVSITVSTRKRALELLLANKEPTHA